MAETNTEFLERVMNFGHPLKQVIVLEGVKRYVEQMVDFDPDKADPEKWGFLNAHAYKDAAMMVRADFIERGLIDDVDHPSQGAG